MIRKICFALVLLFIAISPIAAQPTEQAINDTFMLSMQIYIYSIFMESYSPGSLTGVEASEQDVTFKDFEITSLELEESFGYTKVSGTITLVTETELEANLSFEGGPIKSFKWEVTEKDDTAEIAINADGYKTILDSSILENE